MKSVSSALLIWMIFIVDQADLFAQAMEKSMVKSVRVVLKAGGGKVVKQTLGIFRRQVESRSGASARASGKGGLTVVFDIRPCIGREGFRIEDGSDGEILITGSDERGLLYGVGKFLRTSRFWEGGFEPGEWRGASVPAKDLRGIYFATHFHNFYHDAPVKKIAAYLEELALWGYNALTVWFDMHHYRGMSDPEARKMIRRLRSILSSAKGVGMDVGLVVIANEAYQDSLKELRAEPTGRAHYGVELCPSKPGAKEMVLKWLEEEFKAFEDIGLNTLWIWPYDQGGCGCKQCAPWGAKGFLKMAEPISRLFQRYFPKGKVVLSTWLFDFQKPQGEWEGLKKAFAKHPDWLDFIMADSHETYPEYPLKNGVPGGLPLLNFPEISMWNNWPYGGFGANPFPDRLQTLWNAVGSRLAGGYPYSEGIYEDINKAVISRFYWDPNRKAEDTLREYIAYEYSPEAVEDVLRAIKILEKNLLHVWLINAKGEVERHERPEDHGAEEAYQLLLKSQEKLTPYARSSWRWRILILRALIDRDLKQNKGQPTEACEEAFRELVQIYHARKAEYYVSPPTREAIKAGRKSTGG